MVKFILQKQGKAGVQKLQGWNENISAVGSKGSSPRIFISERYPLEALSRLRFEVVMLTLLLSLHFIESDVVKLE